MNYYFNEKLFCIDMFQTLHIHEVYKYNYKYQKIKIKIRLNLSFNVYKMFGIIIISEIVKYTLNLTPIFGEIV